MIGDTSMASDAYKIDGSSARALDSLLRERANGSSEVPGFPGVRRTGQFCWGKLSNQPVANSGEWNWQECVPAFTPDGKVEWLNVGAADGRGGDTTRTDDANKGTAFELVKGSGGTNKVVLLAKGIIRQKVSEIDVVAKWYDRWFVVAPLPPQAVQLVCTDDLGRLTDTVTCKRGVAIGSATGDPLTCKIIRHTITGDSFYAYPIDLGGGPDNPAFVQIGLPPNRLRGMVLQIMDTTGIPQAIDFDYPQGHI